VEIRQKYNYQGGEEKEQEERWSEENKIS